MKIIEPSKFIKNIFSKFDKNDLLIIIETFIVGLINCFYFIIGNGVSTDSISYSSFNAAGNWEVSLGRFLIKYVNLFRFQLVNKLIVVLICLFCIALAVMLLRRIFNIKNKLSLFLLTLIICVAPQFAETYMYDYCADAYLISFLFSVLTVYFLNKEGKKNYIFAIICTIITCALYQAYLGVILGLLIVLFIYKGTSIKEIIKKILIILVGVILYYICLKCVIKVRGIELNSYKGANNLGMNTILSIPKSILQCYKDFFDFFFTNNIINNAWYKRIFLYIIICLCTIIGMVSKGKIKNIIMTIILLALYPLFANIMNIVAAGTSINLITAVGILTIVLLPILLLEENVNNIFKWGITIGIIVLGWTFLLGNTFTYVYRNQTHDKYKIVMTDIYNKVTSLDDYSSDKEWMISSVIWTNDEDYDKTNGFNTSSAITWDIYDGLGQNEMFFKKYMGIDIKIVNKDTYDLIKNTNEFKSMPVYPEPGSIKIINNTVVVKTAVGTY